MAVDLDDYKISSVKKFRPLGAVQASILWFGIGRKGGTFCVLSRVASQLKSVLVFELSFNCYLILLILNCVKPLYIYYLVDTNFKKKIFFSGQKNKEKK